ncbi:MAG: hypothetical protein M1549_02245 [Candidatus Dependentiae bacterium]|nr:hypothetical protein [Candidatus Dependentiae bacterium]
MKHVTFLLFALFAIPLPQSMRAGSKIHPRSNFPNQTVQEWTGAMGARAAGGTAGIGLMLLGGAGLWYAQGWRKKLCALGALGSGALLTYLCRDGVYRLGNDIYTLGESAITPFSLWPPATTNALAKMSSKDKAEEKKPLTKGEVALNFVKGGAGIAGLGCACMGGLELWYAKNWSKRVKALSCLSLGLLLAHVGKPHVCNGALWCTELASNITTNSSEASLQDKAVPALIALSIVGFFGENILEALQKARKAVFGNDA